MNKGTKKKPNYNQDAINALISRYGYSNYYIRQCVNGNAKGEMPDIVKKEYSTICTNIEKAKAEAIRKFSKS